MDKNTYCQSRGAHNIKHINLWKVVRGHLNTDAQARDRTRNFLLTADVGEMVKNT